MDKETAILKKYYCGFSEKVPEVAKKGFFSFEIGVLDF